ncbi:MAG TPA: hypothetical protein PK151_06910 [Caldisericia bacterium]|nr:hypothetical protein [Caldisericia bacterium]
MRKIGEVFEYKGVMLQVRIDYKSNCDGCFFNKNEGCFCMEKDSDITGICIDDDGNHMLFAKYTPTIIEVDDEN